LIQNPIGPLDGRDASEGCLNAFLGDEGGREDRKRREGKGKGHQDQPTTKDGGVDKCLALLMVTGGRGRGEGGSVLIRMHCQHDDDLPGN